MKTQTSPTLSQQKVHFYRQIAFTFIGAATVVLLGIIYFSLSQAQIVVTPTLEEVSADFRLLVKADEDRTSEGVKAILHTTSLNVERVGSADLQEDGEDQPATGTVLLTNTSGSAQPLVATTRLLSEEGVLFRLSDPVTVPAGGEVEASVYADVPGKGGEISATRFTIPGLNQARQQEVYAESDRPMTGGTKAIYLITQENVDSAIEEANALIVQQAKEQLASEGVNVDGFLSSAQYVEVVSQTVTPEVGTSAQDFTVVLEAMVAFVEADEQDLLGLAQKELFNQTSLGYELSSSNDGSFTYELESFDKDAQQAQVHVVLSGERRISANHPMLDVSEFVGRKPLEIEAELEQDPGISDVTIELRPFWLRKVPRLVDHIYVNFSN